MIFDRPCGKFGKKRCIYKLCRYHYDARQVAINNIIIIIILINKNSLLHFFLFYKHNYQSSCIIIIIILIIITIFIIISIIIIIPIIIKMSSSSASMVFLCNFSAPFFSLKSNLYPLHLSSFKQWWNYLLRKLDKKQTSWWFLDGRELGDQNTTHLDERRSCRYNFFFCTNSLSSLNRRTLKPKFPKQVMKIEGTNWADRGTCKLFVF